MQEKIAVVLLNLGGPDSLDAVEPFLFNLFNDPDIINFPLSFLFRERLARLISSKRAPRVQEQYKKIGGKSPLKEHTLRQAEMLEERLNKDFPARVFVAMRYWEPFTEKAVKQIADEGISRVILLPLYPHYSKATTHSSVSEWERKVAELNGACKFQTDLIESYYEFPAYIDALIERVTEGLEQFPESERGDVHLLFSAHGTPMKLVREGDPYSDHIKKTVASVMNRGGYINEHSLCYQSKVGPQKWLRPSTPEMIESLAKRGVKKMLAIPVAFASDHLETLFEVGMEFKRMALDTGVEKFEVTKGLNDSPAFIEALSQLVLERIREKRS